LFNEVLDPLQNNNGIERTPGTQMVKPNVIVNATSQIV